MLVDIPLDVIKSNDMKRYLNEKGYYHIVGIDEAGRGCSAGNVVASCVILPSYFHIKEITDSKKVNKKLHRQLAEQIKEQAIAYGIGEVTPEVIDEINILNATKLAMQKAVQSMIDNFHIQPDILLIDGNFTIDSDIPQTPIIKGDSLSYEISCASIIAKNHKDKHMKEIDKELDYKYGWSSNSGYQTAKHLEAIKKHGVSKYHRKSYKTFKKLGLT